MSDPHVNYEAVREAMDGAYKMEMKGKDAIVVQFAVNQGIDAYLEACFVPDRGDSYEVVSLGYNLTALKCCVSIESMPVLLRRLLEEDGELAERAHQLAESIMDQLEVERE